MRIHFTESFYKDFQSLPKMIKNLSEKKLKIFGDNPHHPSIRVKKMEGFIDVWEGRITKSYRFTFELEKDMATLRRIGTHDILRKP